LVPKIQVSDTWDEEPLLIIKECNILNKILDAAQKIEAIPINSFKIPPDTVMTKADITNKLHFNRKDFKI
tara:strand:- start:274 stop:483 length:210 start_codon:yes stop_codon:yes gene_type:complete